MVTKDFSDFVSRRFGIVPPPDQELERVLVNGEVVQFLLQGKWTLAIPMGKEIPRFFTMERPEKQKPWKLVSMEGDQVRVRVGKDKTRLVPVVENLRFRRSIKELLKEYEAGRGPA